MARAQKLQNNRDLSSHDFSMRNESRRRQAFSEFVSDHSIRAQRDQLDSSRAGLHQFVYGVSTDVDVSRNFAVRSSIFLMKTDSGCHKRTMIVSRKFTGFSLLVIYGFFSPLS